MMATISTQLRNFKEPTKDQLTEIFFSLPSQPSYGPELAPAEDVEKMDLNAVLSLGVEGEEDSYVSN
jgi:TBC1 domain family member 8/9